MGSLEMDDSLMAGAQPAAPGSSGAPTPHSAVSAPHWLFRHWLALVNLGAAVFAGLPVAAPALIAAGWHGPALLIYALYHSACHNWPGRSYFLFGPQLVYPMDQLDPVGLGTAREFVGSAAMGFKVAYCERDFAIYTTVLFAGLLYALLRARVRPLPWHVLLVALVPIALDGFTQLFGLRESTWELRTLTGVLAGFAGVWLLYPRVDRAMGMVVSGPSSALSGRGPVAAPSATSRGEQQPRGAGPASAGLGADG